uniref:hypothetical protein n=1 Tax=Marivirga sp. TaxID=2018662 RepID=UPI0025F46D64
DASDFISNGINYLEADQGFDFRSRQHAYVSNQWTKKKWYGKKETHISTSTTVKGTNLQSAAGKNILKTEYGGLESVATNFISPGGTEIYAKNDVNLYSLKSENREYNYTSKYFGLSKNVRDETHQSSTPNLFYDDGVTVIHSSEGHIDARGAYFAGDGDLEMKAKKRIKFGADILEHEVTEKSRTFGVSLPGMDAYNAYKSSGKIFDAATAEDATLAKLEGWLKSGNRTETLANSVNLEINLYNTTNSIYRGLANDSLGKEMMARYGLGGENGFSPTINFTLTEKTSVSKYQTQGLGGVDRGGNVKLEAGEGIDLENGVQVHAGGDMDINSPEVIARAAGLQSSSKETTKSLGVGITATGEVADVSASYSKTTTQATNFINAGISADGNMKLHDNDKAMGKLELDGAIINAGTLDADIDQLIINDKQDVFTSKSESASASSTGAVSAYAGETKKVTTVEHSGIHVKDGINTNGHRVHVGEATMNGGKITSDGKNEIDIDTLHARQLKDEEHSKGMGVSFNVNDLQRMAGQKPSNSAGEQAIAVGEVSIDRVNKQTVQNPVIYGAQGTAANIKNLDGIIHTSSSDGATVIKDDELHLQIDVPLTNGAYIKQAQENIAAGSEKIAEKMGWKKEPKIPDNLEMDKNAIPSKREEELSQEDMEKSGVDDIDIDADITECLSGLSIDDIHFDSPELQELFESIKLSLEKATNNDSDINYPEDKKNKSKLKNAVSEVVKTWLEETLSVGKEVVLEKDNSFTTKAYLAKTGIVFQFIFNMGSAYFDEEADHEHMMKEGVTRTLSDITFGAILKYGLRTGAGPAGLTFTGLGIMDDFTYNEQFITKQSDAGVNDLWEAQRLQRQGQYFDSFNRGLLARDKIAASNQARAGHELISNANKGLKDFYSYVWNKASPKQTEQKESNQIQNSNRFFSANKSGNNNKNQTPPNELASSSING